MWFAVPVLSIASAACSGTPDQDRGDGPLGEVESALEITNALNPNALNPNALNPNALSPNALAGTPLNPHALAPVTLNALGASGPAGELSRELVRYVVGCALDETQSFSFSWTDAAGQSHVETYWGLLGLATYWADTPLDVAGQEWISACLASRTNWYGVPVWISSRGPLRDLAKTSLPEVVDFPDEEGAFWGNLFAGAPRLYACHHPENDANSRLLRRDCAAGHLDPVRGVEPCGPIQLVGSCDDVCSPLNTVGRYHALCTSGAGEVSTRVITTFLP